MGRGGMRKGEIGREERLWMGRGREG